ncbi:hypothetical protein [Natrinema gelatinilyticum]|uniref:hypothetical protein n=1 Tax=Natrinema gelatinilyticum TaxID=2961571 RepID=UPI0020C46757|nr:hypothetical protein [Natrinema gelatinilyticum]
MRRSQTTAETEDESDGWLDRVRGRSKQSTTDDSGSLLDRARGRSSDSTTGDSGNVLDRAKGRLAEPTTDDSQSRFDRMRAKYGLGTLLVAAGAVLFLFPEPITSTAGVVLIGAGVLLWLVGWLR